MTFESRTQTRSWHGVARALLPPLVIGGSALLLLLVLAQVDQTCNGVQSCPPPGTRAGIAGSWALVIALATPAAAATRMFASKLIARVVLIALIVLGISAVAVTLFVTGF